LCFTSDEAAEFLKKIFELSLTPEQITFLENRTEGWIAGLQMAAISMQGRSDISHFIEVFSGSHRFIMDYLTEEALNRQSIETQEFLLRTSILERLSEPLCDFVLAEKSNKGTDNLSSIDDFSIPPRENKNLLKELEISNLFIVPLDDDRVWYRYHHLFADLLRSRLEQTSPDEIPILHTRASAWYEKNGWIEESISHSLAARDWDNVSRLIDHHVHTYLENGQMATVMKWIEGLPQGVIFRYPKLCVQIAEVYKHAGIIDQIDPLLSMAEETVSAMESHAEDIEVAHVMKLTKKDATIIRAKIAILRGLKLVLSGDPGRTLNLTRAALAEIPEIELGEQAELLWVEGWAYRCLGNLDLALGSLTKAAEFAPESGSTFLDVWTDLAIVTGLVGKLPQAIGIFTNLLETTADRGVQFLGGLSRDEAFLSLVLLEQNQLELAMAHANRAIAANQWWPSHNTTATAYASLAQILLAMDDLDGSLSAIQKADQERKNRLMTPFVHSIVDVTLASIWLQQGKWDLLDQWSIDQIRILNTISEKGEIIDEYLEMRLIKLIRVWIEKTKNDKNPERNEDCLRLLAKLEVSSQTAGRINSLVEILFLRAVNHFVQGNQIKAIECLEKSLSMAESGGYMRIFLDTGESGRILLITYLEKINPIHKSYALKILRAFGSFLQKSNSSNELPEAITPREMEVLNLLAVGYSNRQIAEKLFLAEGTIKFHVHNLLGKLQIESRTQAIAKAKDLELI
jgi:LuxR family maltose regulon positive regulatory protein